MRANIETSSGAQYRVDSPAHTPDRVGALNRRLQVDEAELGRGRSAVVHRSMFGGSPTARKIFVGESLSAVVLMLLTGAGNPYSWCEAAVQAAAVRREMLSELVRFWFGERLRLPRTRGYGWREDYQAFELRAELIDGYHTKLPGPWANAQGDGQRPLENLTQEIMGPLQRHLIASGFDGLVWQAGFGNPVGASNFMIDPSQTEPDGQPRWAWIDTESGVPALFALNVWQTLRYYLPRSIHHGGALFDDVDTEQLRAYLDEHRTALVAKLGQASYDRLQGQRTTLCEHQTAWKSMPRHLKGITQATVRGRLTQERARWYEARPLAWVGHTLWTAAARGAQKLAALAVLGMRRLTGLNLGRIGRAIVRFVSSGQYRAELAQRYVRTRLQGWKKRRHLDEAELETLETEMQTPEVSVSVTDFGIHVALKPLVKGIEYGVVPLLFAAGVLDVVTVATILAVGGSVARTTYTLGRAVQNSARGQRIPWVALGVGLLPVVGNAAFPVQLLADGADPKRGLARFLIVDLFAKAGRMVPVWGGPDTLTEHAFARIGYRIAGQLARMGRQVVKAS